MGLNPLTNDIMSDEDNQGTPDPSQDGGDKTPNNDIKDFDWDSKFEELGIEDDDFRKEIKTRDFQRKHNSDKAKKLATEFEEYKIKYPPKEEKSKEDKTSKKNDSEERFTKLELKVLKPDLSYEDIDEAITLARVKNISPSEALENPIFKAYLASKQSDIQAQNATPAPSNRSGEKASISKFDNMPQGDLSNYLRNASEEEMEKYREWARGHKAPGEIGNGLIIKRSKNY